MPNPIGVTMIEPRAVARSLADLTASQRKRRGEREQSVPYSTDALRHDLFRLEKTWDTCQEKRQRNAIYEFLAAVFDCVSCWLVEGKAETRARRALRLKCPNSPDIADPFSAVLYCTSETARSDKRTRAKWTRLMRYAAAHKDIAEPLEQFIRRRGGINRCADRGKGLGRPRILDL